MSKPRPTQPSGKSHCGSEACGGEDVYCYDENPCGCNCETRCGPWNRYLDDLEEWEREQEAMSNPDDGHDWKAIANDYRAQNVALEREVFILKGKLESAVGAREHFREEAERAADKASKLEVAAAKVSRRGERFRDALEDTLAEHAEALRKLAAG